MKAEIEVKFANIQIDEIREALQKTGAHLEQPMRLMRRAIIEEPHHKAEHAFIRVRDEGDKVTMTFKRRTNPDHPTADGVHELEVVVSDFDGTVAIFGEAGWHYTTFQESKRETWTLDNTEIVIDQWPWLPPYIEIEGQNEASLQKVAKKLGLDWSDVEYGHIDNLYEQKYEFKKGVRGVIDIPEVRFDAPVPPQFVLRKNR